MGASGEKKLVAKVGMKARVTSKHYSHGIHLSGGIVGRVLTATAVRGGEVQWDGVEEWRDFAFALSGYVELLSDTADAGTVGVGETNWAAYLPKEPLPTRPGSKWRQGQVIAVHDPGDGERLVLRVDVQGAFILAGKTVTPAREHCSLLANDSRSNHAVLICNPGETPPPPEVVFGKQASPHSLDRGAAAKPGRFVGAHWTGGSAGGFTIIELLPDRRYRIQYDDGDTNVYGDGLEYIGARFDGAASPPPSPSLGEAPAKKPVPKPRATYASLMAEALKADGVPEPAKCLSHPGAVLSGMLCPECYAAADAKYAARMVDRGLTTSPVEPEPWRPEVTEWDLLPGPCEFGSKL